MAQFLPASIVAHHVELSLLIQGIEVQKLKLLQIRRQPGKNSCPHQAEFFSAGNQNTGVRIAALFRGGESCDYPTGVVPCTRRGTSKPSATGEQPGQQRQPRAASQPAEANGATEPQESQESEDADGGYYGPYGDQSARHRVALSLRVQMRNDPSTGAAPRPSSHDIGIFPEALIQGCPAQPYSGRQYSQSHQSGDPHRESRPIRQ